MLWKIQLVVSLISLSTLSIACPRYCTCEHQTIDCSSRKLTALPYDLPTQVAPHGTTGSPNLLGTASQFTSLNLANNELEELPTALLSDKLPHLRRLDLSNNKILEISRIQSIILSKELLYFDLSSNPIRSLGLNENTILYSQSISHLDVSNCAISSITNSLSLMFMLNLTHINLSGNPLVVVDHLVSSTLNHLDLSNCQLGDKGIREESFKNLSKLLYLNLSMNAQLTKLPTSVQLSSSLLHLDASYCAFEKLDLRSFPKLQHAVLKGNILKVLYNDMISGNADLQSLDVSENSIHVIEKFEFTGSNSLKKLDLSSNLISNLNWNVFLLFSQLNTLNISRNLLTSLDEIPIPSLTSLDASKCEIFRLGSRFLVKASNLRCLNLSYNAVEKLPKRILSRKLQHLDLSYCRISDLQYETFQELSLTTLNLMGNRLTIPIKGSLLDQLVNIKELILSNNPWHCDCNDPELKKFWKLSTSYLVKTEYLSSLICNSPKEMAGVSLQKNCFENLNKHMHAETKYGPWFSFFVPFLTLCCLLAIVIVIRQAYTNHSLELQERETTNQRLNSVQNGQNSHTVPVHFFDEDLERGIQMSVNESTQRSSIRQLSKLPSYEEALLLPNPQSRENLQKIVENYEEHGMFAVPVTDIAQSHHIHTIRGHTDIPSTSGE